MGKYVFGFDFGTLSCRGVAVNLENGELAATAESRYQHGVISDFLPDGNISLEDGWFLQEPDDWIDSMCEVSVDLLKASGVQPGEVLGIGTDFTSCTMVACGEDGKPLCKDTKFRQNPNAWPKLWKHHGAQKYAEEIERYAKSHTEWLKKYFGNSVSSEWMFPKILQVLRESPEVYDETELFIEAVDWIVLMLTGNIKRNGGVLGVNAFWIKGEGYPDKNFCKALDERMEDLVETKLKGDIAGIGDCAGYLLPVMAKKLGLLPGTIVSSGHSDGAVAGCGAGVTESGSMMLVMGTSTCHQMMCRDFKSFDGVCSIAADGMVPGLYGYESGQPATGDLFQWFSKNAVPSEYQKNADEAGKDLLSYLGELAERLTPGESGLVALDWFNGNRSVLSDYNLSGVIVGLTLNTRTEEIYRALVEGNIFGSRRIIENYEFNGVHIHKLYAVGGIALKSPWIMQMCADVMGREIFVPQIDNVPARGSAACAAVAVGNTYGYPGCADFKESSERLIPKTVLIYRPDKEKNRLYNELYRFYIRLHDAFGEDDSFMRGLKNIGKEKRIGDKK